MKNSTSKMKITLDGTMAEKKHGSKKDLRNSRHGKRTCTK
jgi:hypothetical protein